MTTQTIRNFSQPLASTGNIPKLLIPLTHGIGNAADFKEGNLVQSCDMGNACALHGFGHGGMGLLQFPGDFRGAGDGGNGEDGSLVTGKADLKKKLGPLIHQGRVGRVDALSGVGHVRDEVER